VNPRARRTQVAMGTFVTVDIVDRDSTNERASDTDRDAAIDRAFGWFTAVEACCSRFDQASELRQLSARVGVAVPVSPLLYETIQFALAVADESGGAFDPTVGRTMEARGFNREYRTGQLAESGAIEPDATYRDIQIDPEQKTVTILRPLTLDLGAVAKGLAIDLAVRELMPFGNFAVYAGGDLYLGGRNASGEAWRIGIQHPRREGELIDAIRVSDSAVCTSGDYERRAPDPRDGHHILDPRTGAAIPDVASVTSVAPTAMLADAVATAAFVLGPSGGIALFERLGVNGLIVSSTLERFATRGFRSEYTQGGQIEENALVGDRPVLQDAEGSPDDRAGDPARAGNPGRRY
jgi:thiamine biosynthesis lipoprotein